MTGRQLRLTLTLVVISAVAGAAASSWFFAGRPALAQDVPAVAKIVAAQEFRLAEADGQTRAWLRCGANGEVGIFCYPDIASRFRVVLGMPTEKNGMSYLSFFDPSDRQQVRLGYVEGKGPCLALYDARGNPTVIKP